jgi:hypothetical protein
VQLGIGLAVVAALMGNLASLLKHRGCHRAAPVRMRNPLRSARDLASSPWFVAGWGLAAVAWMVHVAALSMAPISIVQAVLAGGAVSLAVMAQRVFGDPVQRRQWYALLLGGSGLALLVLTVPHFSGSHSGFSIGAMLASRVGWRCSPRDSSRVTAPGASPATAASCSRSSPEPSSPSPASRSRACWGLETCRSR